MLPRSERYAAFRERAPEAVLSAMHRHKDNRSPYEQGLVDGWLAGRIEAGLDRVMMTKESVGA
jgi:hypothetical protein